MNATIKRILSGTAGVVVSLSLLTLTPPTIASATEAHAVATATSHGDISVSADFESVTAQTTDAQGRYIGAWFNSNAKHWSAKKALRVKYAKSFAAGAASCKPFRLKKGQWYPRTLKLIDGVPVEVKGGSHVKHAWSLFDFAKGDCSTPRHRGYSRKPKHKWYDDCVTPKPGADWKVVDSVIEVKQHTATTWYLKTTWNAKAQVFGSVAVDCGTASSKASFTATGETTGSLDVKVVALTEAEARAKGKTQVEPPVKSDTSVEGKIKLDAETKAEGKAEASCTSTPPPPSVPAPSILEITTVNDFRTGQEGFITATGTVASGHTANLFASAKNGGTIIANKSQTVSGNFTVNVTYKASTEVGTDQAEFTLTQDDGQKATKSTNVFNILERQPTP